MEGREAAVLRALRNDAREQFTSISAATGIPTTTVFDIYHRLQAYMTKRAALLDYDALGFPFVYFFTISDKPCVRELIDQADEVNSAWALADDTVIVEVVFDDIEARDAFVKQVSACDCSYSFVARTDVLKHEAFFS
jgi:DNA-binding Lrp family transcriptional regulator